MNMNQIHPVDPVDQPRRTAAKPNVSASSSSTSPPRWACLAHLTRLTRLAAHDQGYVCDPAYQPAFIIDQNETGGTEDEDYV